MYPTGIYLAVKSTDIENNHLVAEPLSDVVSAAEPDVASLNTEVDPRTGVVKVVAGNKKGHIPHNSEGLRYRLGLLGRCWLLLRTKHTNRPYLLDLTPQSLV